MRSRGINVKSSGSAIKLGSSQSLPNDQNLLMNYMLMQNQANASNQSQVFNLTPEESARTETKPSLRDVKRIPTPVNDIQEKKQLPDELIKALGEQKGTADNLIQNANTVMQDPSISNQMGPLHPSAWSDAIGSHAMDLRSVINDFMGKNGFRSPEDVSNESKNIRNFQEFKSQTADLFQRYRKFLDGVRAAVGASQLESPIFPKTDSPPDVFLGKTLGVLRNMDTNFKSVSSLMQKQGFRTSGLEGYFPSDQVDELRSKISPIPGSPGFQETSANKSGSVDEDAIFKRNMSKLGLK